MRCTNPYWLRIINGIDVSAPLAFSFERGKKEASFSPVFRIDLSGVAGNPPCWLWLETFTADPVSLNMGKHHMQRWLMSRSHGLESASGCSLAKELQVAQGYRLKLSLSSKIQPLILMV